MIKLGILQPGPWRCGRTCTPGNLCRFTAVLVAAGVTHQVVSHTVKVQVEYKDPDALKAAVEAMGGRWLGHGEHRLFDGSMHTGHAWHLAKWQYPMILRDLDGVLAYDDYNGRWGKVSDLDILRGSYAVEAALQAATAQGWMSERNADGTATVYHPEGGTLRVTPSGIEGAGFCGEGCQQPAELLAAAMGRPTEQTHTGDYYAEHARLQQSQAE